MESRVGYATTSILENMLKDYIKAFPKDVEMIEKYIRLYEYNHGKSKNKMEAMP